MRIKTALEDFVKTTLAAVPGYWQKLLYLGELRHTSAEYDHWGLKRRYGKAASLTAMEKAHTNVFLDILRTPISILLADLRTSAHQQARSEQEYLEMLQQQRESIVPASDGGGSVSHFEVTVLALESLTQAEAEADRPSESRHPRPGQ